MPNKAGAQNTATITHALPEVLITTATLPEQSKQHVPIERWGLPSVAIFNSS